MINVLLVEDDKAVGRIIKYYLAQEECYEIVWAENAQEALRLSHDHFDVILLDIMLPDTDGIDLCKDLRQRHSCPIIFISCLDNSETIVKALDMGGDDYITKPFDNTVLNARIRANLRRVYMKEQPAAENKLVCSGFSVDASTHTLEKGGNTYPLGETEFKLLSFFMQNPGRCFTSSELFKEIWGRVCYGDYRTVAVHIHSLRQKIEDDIKNPRYIKSIWVKGYLFDPDAGKSLSD